MPRNLFATIGTGNDFKVKRITTDANTQREITAIFKSQEAVFLRDVEVETPFTGSYTPDQNELLYIDDLAEINAMRRAIEGNATSYDLLSENELNSGIVRSIFSGTSENGNCSIGIQYFQRNQVLERHRTIILSGQTYNKLSNAGLTIGSSLTAFIYNNRMKFSSYAKARRIFDLTDTYREATTQEVRNFTANDKFSVDDSRVFEVNADQVIRKKIFQINQSGILDNYTVDQFYSAARELDLALTIIDNKIQMPSDKQEIKAVLNFFDDSVFRSSLTEIVFYANSKRVIV